MLRRVLLVVAIAAVAPGCSTVKGWFGGSSKNEANEPAELTRLAAPIGVSKLWDASLGEGEGRLWLRQHPALDGHRIYATHDKGVVVALVAGTGAAIHSRTVS